MWVEYILYNIIKNRTINTDFDRLFLVYRIKCFDSFMHVLKCQSPGFSYWKFQMQRDWLPAEAEGQGTWSSSCRFRKGLSNRESGGRGPEVIYTSGSICHSCSDEHTCGFPCHLSAEEVRCDNLGGLNHKSRLLGGVSDLLLDSTLADNKKRRKLYHWRLTARSEIWWPWKDLSFVLFGFTDCILKSPLYVKVFSSDNKLVILL